MPESEPEQQHSEPWPSERLGEDRLTAEWRFGDGGPYLWIWKPSSGGMKLTSLDLAVIREKSGESRDSLFGGRPAYYPTPDRGAHSWLAWSELPHSSDCGLWRT